MKMITSPEILSLIIKVIVNLVEGLIGLRVILKLFGASTQAPFVGWIYETSDPLLSPFVGMFPSPEITAGLVIEFSALFALLFYAFIGYLALEVLATLTYYSQRREGKSGRK